MEIFICSFVPKVCPACGEPTNMGKMSISDFLNGCAFTCDCGVRYQYVHSKALLETAKQHGDMGLHWR